MRLHPEDYEVLTRLATLANVSIADLARDSILDEMALDLGAEEIPVRTLASIFPRRWPFGRPARLRGDTQLQHADSAVCGSIGTSTIRAPTALPCTEMPLSTPLLLSQTSDGRVGVLQLGAPIGR
ncbi:hypothetical protein [Nocardia xishanensis]